MVASVATGSPTGATGALRSRAQQLGRGLAAAVGMAPQEGAHACLAEAGGGLWGRVVGQEGQRDRDSRARNRPRGPGQWVSGLCESTIGLFKTEAINLAGPAWKDRAAVEWQVARWVTLYNGERLHSPIPHTPPIEYEQRYRQASTTTPIPQLA